MAKGPRRMTAETARAKGAYRSDRYGDLPPSGDGQAAIAAPKWLNSQDQAYFDTLVKLLNDRRVITLLDAPALESLVWWRGQALYLMKRVSQAQAAGEDAGPLLRLAIKADTSWRSLAERFGMNPASRATMRMPAPKPENPVLRIIAERAQ